MVLDGEVVAALAHRVEFDVVAVKVQGQQEG